MLPDALGECKKLMKLTLSSAKNISVLPEFIGNFKELRQLYLEKTKIAALPPSLKQCSNLENLDLKTDCLEAIPDWIEDFPKLEMLWVWESQAINSEVEKRLLERGVIIEK